MFDHMERTGNLTSDIGFWRVVRNVSLVTDLMMWHDRMVRNHVLTGMILVLFHLLGMLPLLGFRVAVPLM